MPAVGCDQAVERWPDEGEGRHRAQSGQPPPAGNLGHDSLPGGKAVEQNTVAIPNPHRSLVLFAGQGQFVAACGTEIDEPNPLVAITNFAPRLGSLA